MYLSKGKLDECIKGEIKMKKIIKLQMYNVNRMPLKNGFDLFAKVWAKIGLDEMNRMMKSWKRTRGTRETLVSIADAAKADDLENGYLEMLLTAKWIVLKCLATVRVSFAQIRAY